MQHSRHLTKLLGTLLAAAGIALTGAPVLAQGVSQYMPLVTYRTGPYGPSGTPGPTAWTTTQAGQCARRHQRREARLRGVRDRLRHRAHVECYERLKTKNGGAVVFQPWSTGITFA
jgi:branched-chain amino acid transport system substrate-binding protein